MSELNNSSSAGDDVVSSPTFWENGYGDNPSYSDARLIGSITFIVIFICCIIIFIVVIIMDCIEMLNWWKNKRKRRVAHNIEMALKEKKELYQNRVNKANEDREICVICYENVQCTKLDCGHATLCHICAHKIQELQGICPICRRSIKEIEEEVFLDDEYIPQHAIV